MQKKKIIWLVLGIFVLLAMSCIGLHLIMVDCSSLHFVSIYEMKDTNLKDNFNLYIQNNTRIFKNCSETGISNLTDSNDVYLSRFGINTYNVSYSCDLANFTLLIYQKNLRFYRMGYGMGPCGRDNIYFDDNQTNQQQLLEQELIYYGYEINSPTQLESSIIRDQSKDLNFCIKIKTLLNTSKDDCYFIQAQSIPYNDNYYDYNSALYYCNMINKTYWKINCYKHVAGTITAIISISSVSESEKTAATAKANDICSTLNKSISDDDLDKIYIYKCFDSVKYGPYY